MSRVQSKPVYTQFPNFVAPLAVDDARRPRKAETTAAANYREEIETPCCFLLKPASGSAPYAHGAVLLSRRLDGGISRFTFSALAVELPPPQSLGEYDGYEAVLFEPGVASFVAALAKTPGGAWAGTLSGITLGFSPTMRAVVRPVGTETGRSGESILSGDVASCSSR